MIYQDKKSSRSRRTQTSSLVLLLLPFLVMSSLLRFELATYSPVMLNYLFNRRHRQQTHEIYERRSEFGEFHHLYPKLRSDDRSTDLFRSYARMNVSTFDYLVETLKPEFEFEVTNFQRPIGIEERVLLTLRFLATGILFRQLAFSFRTSKTAVAGIVKMVCIAIWKRLNHLHMPIPTVEQYLKNSSDFYERWGFPHVVGCLDGKHIRIKRPDNSGSMYHNYKMFFSVSLMAVVDANYKFVVVDVGAYGKDSDGGVLSNSIFGKSLLSGQLPLPAEAPLPKSTIVAPYVFLADEAYPLTPNLMRPYPQRRVQQDNELQNFNYRLSRARLTVECAFGQIANKFKILLRPMETKVDHSIAIVKAITLLHNMIIDKEGMRSSHTNQSTNIGDFVRPTRSSSTNRSAGHAIHVRDSFKDYFRENPLQ